MGLLTPCARVMASVLWEQRSGKPGERRHQAIWGGIAIPVKLSLILAAAMPFSAVPSTGWRHSYRLGLSEMIYELGPNTCRNKKCKGNRYSCRQKAGKMLRVWQVLLLICSCFALSCLLRLKKNQTNNSSC